uniref:G-protein coupled receptors family 1 profile domain-containing protein n=1 Tax=Setaria digitata TaxID=48799 RepID=A0A915Q7A4_9BILA
MRDASKLVIDSGNFANFSYDYYEYVDDQDFLANDPIVRNVAAVTLLIYFFALVVGIPANIYVLIRMKKLAKNDRERYRNGTGIALCSMAAADLCSLLLILSQNLMRLYPQLDSDELFMHFVCKVPQLRSLQTTLTRRILSWTHVEEDNKSIKKLDASRNEIDQSDHGVVIAAESFWNRMFEISSSQSLIDSIICVECLASVGCPFHSIRLHSADTISITCLEPFVPYCRMTGSCNIGLKQLFSAQKRSEETSESFSVACNSRNIHVLVRHKHSRTLWRWLAIALISITLNIPENMYRLVILFGMPDVHEEALHFSARMLAQALYFSQFAFNAVYLALFVFDKSTRPKSYFEHSTGRNSVSVRQSCIAENRLREDEVDTNESSRLIMALHGETSSNFVRVPSRFRFDARIYIPVQILRHEECRAPFIVAHGPRSLEFELRISMTGSNPENPSLVVKCQDELNMRVAGLIAIRFGVSKDTDNTAAADALMHETQETNFEYIFVMRGMDPFLESMQKAITSVEYGNGSIGISILITYQASEFMHFLEQKSKLRSLTPTEYRNIQLNSKAYNDFELFGANARRITYSKWLLYMGTKYFHHLIDENPAIDRAKLNYSHDVINYALSLALQNWFTQELRNDIRKMRETIELLCILEPINVDIAIEAVAIQLHSILFNKWSQIDLDEIVRILTLPKYWELEELKVAARSVIIDVHSKQFQEQYNEQSTGARCAVYRDLIFSGALDETSKPMESELEKIKQMSWKMSAVKKTVDFVEIPQ